MSIFDAHVGSYFATGESTDFEQFLIGLDGGEADGDIHYWVGFVEERPAACGGVEVKGETASLIWGMIRTDVLGIGLGRALLVHRLNWIKTTRPQVKKVLANTAPLTEGFFAHHGFRTYRREHGYWGGEIDLAAMELSL